MYNPNTRRSARKFTAPRRTTGRRPVQRKRYTKRKSGPGYTRTSGYYGRYNNSPGDEVKFFDTSISLAVDATPEDLLNSVNLIPQGTTQSNRIGRKCQVVSMGFQGELLWGTQMTLAQYKGGYIKIAIVLDMQANGAAPAWTDVYDVQSTFSYRNMANIDRFKVLKSWVLTPGSLGTAIASFDANTVTVSPTPLNWYKKCKIPLEFSSTTGAITELKSNNITILAASDAGDDIHTLAGFFRVHFTG